MFTKIDSKKLELKTETVAKLQTKPTLVFGASVALTAFYCAPPVVVHVAAIEAQHEID